MAANEARIITNPDELSKLDWQVPGAIFEPDNHDSSFEITRAFERQNNVLLDKEALQYFKTQIESRFSAN